MREIILKGVRQNNLRNIDLNIPLGKSVVVTGPSGSGKSSLAFETVHAEGQRRYMQSLSTYARQFLERFRAPLMDSMHNVPPTIALEQINPVRNSRATVGTSTEIYDYLRLLFEKIGVEYCPNCEIPMEVFLPLELYEEVVRRRAGEQVLIAFREELPKAHASALLSSLLRSGFTRVIVDQKLEKVEDLLNQSKLPKEILVVIDRVKLSESGTAAQRSRFLEAVRLAFQRGHGFCELVYEKNEKLVIFKTACRDRWCPQCNLVSNPKNAHSFSFNSPLGACETCKGFGNILTVDEELAIPNPRLSIAQGAIDPFTKPSLSHWQKKLFEYCKMARIDMDLPFNELPATQRKAIFEGDKKFKGIKGVFALLEKDKYKMRIRVFISRYNSPFTCPSCKGDRLKASVLNVKIAKKNLAQVANQTIGNTKTFLETLPLKKREKEIAKDVLRQLLRRLTTLDTVGLGYLTLSRLTRTLSGGEYQRILLSTQLSQGLTDTLYVLDEPSIGLHPRDTDRLLSVLNNLKSTGNSLLVVEHDPDIILWGEHIIDMGPGSGSRGGTVTFSGSKFHFEHSDTVTAKAVKAWKAECVHELLKPARTDFDQWIEIKKAAGNNLKSINVKFPLQCLVGITGVSGSGKSTLVVDTLYQALSKIFFGKSEKIARFESIGGFEFLSSVELVDQSPIGRSSRSNPITFIKGYDEIRSLFSHTPEAASRGFSPGHFSFNVPGGRCEKCEGEGRIRIDMVFMEDVFIPCDACNEKRFKPEVLKIKYRGKNIDEVLHLTIDDAFDFFRHIPSLRSRFALLMEVGLGYLQLGQPSFSLSGGEAQRLKIAQRLIGTGSRNGATLFMLDEPTTGLHFNEISKLITVLRKLIHRGHSVLVIEHNLQMICAADFLVDLGPDAGEGGGHVTFIGTPKELAHKALPHTGLYLSKILQESKL